jgi:hypothetical protein
MGLLREIPRAGLPGSNYIKQNGLPHNAVSCLRAVDALLFTNALTWDFPPAKLASRLQHEGKLRHQEALKGVQEFVANVRKGEAKAAHEKEQAEYERATLELINAFIPVNRRGQVDYAKQAEVQNHLKRYLAQEKSKGTNLKSVHEAVRAELERQYAISEKSRERV